MGKRSLAGVFFLLFLTWGATASPPQPPGFLRTQGQEIVNDLGPVILRGVNLGNWLFLEGYLFGAQESPQAGQTGFLQGLEALLGSPEPVTDFLHQWRKTWITRDDLIRIAGLGYNHVRVAFHRDLFIDPQTGRDSNEGFFWLDQLLEWCRPLGIYIIPDLHAAPGGQNSGHVSDAFRVAGLWTDYEKNLKDTQRIWVRIASRYAHEPLIGGWDLLNEPEIKTDKWKLRDAMVTLTKAIRQVDKNHMIIAEGNWFSTSFWELLKDQKTPGPQDKWDKNLVFSFHSYWANIPNPSLKDQLKLAKGVGVPLWLGEFGENSNSWIASQVADMENRSIGWSFWCYKKVEAISGLVEVLLPETYRKILNYWKGGPKPTPEETQEGLDDLLDSARWENALFRRDVASALQGKTFLQGTQPWIRVTIPAIIPASHYDLGAQGQAYKDKDFQAATYPVTPWNHGWAYRNDGVDLMVTSPISRVVGGIEPGEMLQYTFNAPGAQSYIISLRYAAPETPPTVRLVLNGSDLITKTLPTTGGWRSFQNQEMAQVQLPQGTHQLRVEFLASGLDLSQIRIQKRAD